MLFPAYLGSLLRRLKAYDVHVAVETSGHFDWRAIRSQVSPLVDLVYIDVKFAGAVDHRRCTGRGNGVILRNLSRLLETAVEVHARVPLVPGVTATRRNLEGIVDLLLGLGAPDVTLLPYNPLGLETAAQLGRDPGSLPRSFMDPVEEAGLAAYVRTVARGSRRAVTRRHRVR